MREGISLTTLFKALIAFTVIFAAFVSLAVVYNKAYRLKNETLTILEKYEGISETSLKIINNYLEKSGYVTKGSCKSGEYGNKNLSSTTLEKVTNSDKIYYYCISEKCTNGACTVSGDNKIYFNFKLFFRFSLPFFEDLLTFPISGETKKIKFFTLDQRLP